MSDHYEIGEITVIDRIVHRIEYTDVAGELVRVTAILTSKGQQCDLEQLVLREAEGLVDREPFLCARLHLNGGTIIMFTLERQP